LFCEKVFQNFFSKQIEKTGKNFFYFKNIFTKKVKKKLYFKKSKFSFYKKATKKNKKIGRNKKYNFTKVWFIKYNNFILATTFVYFYFKIKSKKIQFKKKAFLQKTPLVF
jgi:hypothetical protein